MSVRAQEIVQDVFITCYAQYDKVPEIEFYKAWIYRITINRSKDALKSGWLKKVILNNYLLSQFKSSSSLENQVIQKEEEQDLLSQVLHLPIKYREILLLYYYEDLQTKKLFSCYLLMEIL